MANDVTARRAIHLSVKSWPADERAARPRGHVAQVRRRHGKRAGDGEERTGAEQHARPSLQSQTWRLIFPRSTQPANGRTNTRRRTDTRRQDNHAHTHTETNRAVLGVITTLTRSPDAAERRRDAPVYNLAVMSPLPGCKYTVRSDPIYGTQ